MSVILRRPTQDWAYCCVQLFCKRITLFTVIGCFILGSLPREITAEHGKQYKLSTICKNHFLRDVYRKIDGAVLTSQNERNLNCAITFQTHSILQRFMLRFDRLQLDCNDHLYIYDGAHAANNFKADLSCRNTHISVGAIYTRTNFVTLKYITDGWGTDANGFRLVITAVKDLKHTCKDFRCTMNEFCIDKDLVCDSVNHCGDGSDEATALLCTSTEASTILGMQRTWFTVALALMVIIMIGAVVSIISCYCRKRLAHPRHTHNSVNTRGYPPVSFPLQQMYESNGASSRTIIGSALVKEPVPIPTSTSNINFVGTGTLLMGATTLPRSGNWLHPAGLRLGHIRRLYCQAK